MGTTMNNVNMQTLIAIVSSEPPQVVAVISYLLTTHDNDVFLKDETIHKILSKNISFDLKRANLKVVDEMLSFLQDKYEKYNKASGIDNDFNFKKRLREKEADEA
jgi:hypothetical protein